MDCGGRLAIATAVDYTPLLFLKRTSATTTILHMMFCCYCRCTNHDRYHYHFYGYFYGYYDYSSLTTTTTSAKNVDSARQRWSIMSNLAAKRETTVTIINQLCGSISRRRCTDGPVHLCSAPAKEPSLERSEEMAVGEGLIGVPARLSPPSQPPHSLRRSAVWPKPRCPDMVICLDTYTCTYIHIYVYACV